MLSWISGQLVVLPAGVLRIVVELDERQQVATGEQRVLHDGAVREVGLALLLRVPLLHRGHAERIAHHEVRCAPRRELGQIHQRLERERIEGDGPVNGVAAPGTKLR